MFVKQGRLAMLSHLELCRALERAVRRAKLPYAVSQGFSPHMRIAFGAALPVGVGGTCEFFDLFLESYVAPQKCLEALRGASAEDLMVQSCGYVEHSAPAASVAFPVSTYCVEFSSVPERFVVPDEVKVVRKKKEKVLAVGDYLVEPVVFEEGMPCATFSLEAKAEGSLRADVFVRSCIEQTIACGGAPADLRVVALTRIGQR